MRRLGAVVFANQWGGGRGAVSYFQSVIVDLSLEPGMTQNKTSIIHLMLFFFICFVSLIPDLEGLDATTLLSVARQQLTDCHLSLFPASTVSLLRSTVSCPLCCLNGFPVTLLSDSLLQYKNICTGRGRVSTAQSGP